MHTLPCPQKVSFVTQPSLWVPSLWMIEGLVKKKKETAQVLSYMSKFIPGWCFNVILGLDESFFSIPSFFGRIMTLYCRIPSWPQDYDGEKKIKPRWWKRENFLKSISNSLRMHSWSFRRKVKRCPYHSVGHVCISYFLIQRFSF